MKAKILLCVILIFWNNKLNAQNKHLQNCNKFTEFEKFKKKIPKDFCMPAGYKCYNFIDNIDLTSDGIDDLIIHCEKSKQKDGDSTFVTIYKKTNDTTFIRLTTLPNLYPLYFENYSLEYHVKDKKLDSLQTKLNGADYFKVEFSKNTILIELLTEAYTGVDVMFNYNYKKKNWFLAKEVFWYGDNINIKREVKRTNIIKNGIPVEKFNMFEYLYD